MTAEAKTKIHAVGSRHTLYLPSELVRDSAFPFKAGEPLVARVEAGRLVVERGTGRRK